MKKQTIIVMALTLFLVLLTACGGQEMQKAEAEQSDQPSVVEETEQTSIPADTDESVEEAESVFIPESSEDVVNAMLNCPKQLYLGDVEKMSQNDGGHFGDIWAEHRFNEDRMEVFAGEGRVDIPFETRLRDFGSDSRAQQAVLVKFQPERTDYVRFDFIGMGDYSITFEEGEWWFVDVSNFSKTSFSEYMPSNLILDGFTIYNILFATDTDMNLRVIIWDDQNYNNQACFETGLYQGMDNIFESNWKMNIIFSYEELGQLNIYEYEVYTFASFIENPPIVPAGE